MSHSRWLTTANRILRLYVAVEAPFSITTEEEANNIEIVIEKTSSTTLSDKLQSKIDVMQQTMPINDANFSKSVIREMNIYELNGKITDNLKQLLEALKTIKPTSTESERIFTIQISER